ncbi:HAD hydrolase-like protein [Pseudoflavitalea sp. G-6-1-2]|uniref:HAD hydrolase-like protein n=1 Tax=Pseudoflavitalea sp. G-6-1-2 TaxID=2728841 RepID=UPI00146DC7E8|nr:HAD hydrolase-like protein [Pseudoflavitalea sp. G-6-1-2]NML19455.1 HAD hydrolase-like protein [Pseudoflavitalea sp. G-6-1-2]
MPSTKLVVFDMAGTTIRDQGNVADAFIEAFIDYGIPKPDNDALNRVMGYRKIDAIRSLLKAGGTPVDEQLVSDIHEHFTELMIRFYEHNDLLEPLTDAENLFLRLHEQGMKVALNTGFTRRIADTILFRLDWINHPHIHAVISSDEVAEGRPAPHMIHSLMSTLGIQNSRDVIKIGDTAADVQEGKNAGCGLVVGITTGACTKEQLQQYGADYIIHNLQELQSLI